MCCCSDQDSVAWVSLLHRGLHSDALANTALQKACGFRGVGPEWVSSRGALGQNCSWRFCDWTWAVSPRPNHTGVAVSDKVGDGLYLQTPSAPFHIVSISKDGQMNALGVNKPIFLVLSFPRSWERERSCWSVPGAAVFRSCRVVAGRAVGARSLCLLWGRNWLPTSPHLFTNILFCSLAPRGKSGRLFSTCLPLPTFLCRAKQILVS